MLLKFHTETNLASEDYFSSLPSDIDINNHLPSEESIKKEFEAHRLLQIYQQLPEHCVQLCFLS